MGGSAFGTIVKITTWGESHGKALGVVLDGCPAGLPLSEADIMPYMNRRRPGQSDFSTKRNEADAVEILSGVFEGKTTGTPISLMVRNTDQRSADYGELAYTYRPGHADYSYDEKYGFRDYRGGGRSSGRETVGRVAAGAVCAKVLSELGISLLAYTRSIGDCVIDPGRFDPEEIWKNPHYMPDADCAARATALLRRCMEEKDSVGSSVECVIRGVPAGIGDPVFDKLDARLAQAVMSLGAVKAVEIGDGVAAATARGSMQNDSFFAEEGRVKKRSNHAGGILGGISDGSDILLRATFKPTPSIYREQDTVDNQHTEKKLSIKGRHDPVIGPRACVVVESMCAITLLDLMLSGACARMSSLKRIYR